MIKIIVVISLLPLGNLRGILLLPIFALPYVIAFVFFVYSAPQSCKARSLTVHYVLYRVLLNPAYGRRGWKVSSIECCASHLLSLSIGRIAGSHLSLWD